MASTSGTLVVQRLAMFQQILPRRDVPDVACVFADGAVGGEPADMGGIADGFGRPFLTVLPDSVDSALGVPIGVEIGGDHEPVIVVKAIDHRPIAIDIVRREYARSERIEDFAQMRRSFD